MFIFQMQFAHNRYEVPEVYKSKSKVNTLNIIMKYIVLRHITHCFLNLLTPQLKNMPICTLQEHNKYIFKALNFVT